MYRPPLSSLAPYLYESWYSNIDYAYAYQWFRSHTPVTSGGCSTVRKGNMIGRNLDWTYSESAEFIVHTDGVVGVANAIPGLTDAFVQSGADDEAYKIVPFMLSDGMNKHGLMVSTLVVPTDKGDNSVVLPLESEEVELCTLMLPRYVLDKFETAAVACLWLSLFAKIYHPKTLQDQHYDQHFFIADSNDTFCLEFRDGVCDFENISSKPFVTNFHLTGVEFNADGSVNTPASGKASDNKITPNGSGLERYNLINSRYASIRTPEQMEQLMLSLSYTRAYQSDPDHAVPRWDTEFVGDGRTVDTHTEWYDTVQMAAATEYQRRTRSSGTTWQTVHSAIYDVQEKKLRIYAQENFDTQWEVSVMADQTHVQHLRGDTAKNDAFTGSAGELTVDMEVKTVRMHDGVKEGGYPLVSTATTVQTIDGTKTFSQYAYGVTAPDEDSSKKLATTEFVHRVARGGTIVVSNPVITGDTSVRAGGTAQYNFSAASSLTGGSVTAFKVSASGAMTLDEVVVPAVSGAGNYTLSIPSGLAAGEQIQFKVIAVDNFGNESRESVYSLTVFVAFVNAPTITAPQNNSDIVILSGVTVSTSAFSVSDGTDTHLNTDYKITSDVAGQVIVAQANASFDLLSHTFPASALSSLVADQTYYIFARHRGTSLGESSWSNAVSVTAKAGQVFAGRAVYRHPNNKGSVIEYDEFGTQKKLFVADAAYRGTAYWNPAAAVPGLKQWPHFYSPIRSSGENVIDTYAGYIDLEFVADLTQYESKLTDQYFQQALAATLAPVIQTAKEATDFMVAAGNCQAATVVRNKTSEVGIEMQLPNIYQLLVLFAEGDMIDALDPTIAANPTFALGKYGTNTYRWNNGGTLNAYSSTEANNVDACTVITYGYSSGPNSGKNRVFGVIPVAEL